MLNGVIWPLILLAVLAHLLWVIGFSFSLAGQPAAVRWICRLSLVAGLLVLPFIAGPTFAFWMEYIGDGSHMPVHEATAILTLQVLQICGVTVMLYNVRHQDARSCQ
jgi:hypothetical protein